jgi:hypothetical protein
VPIGVALGSLMKSPVQAMLVPLARPPVDVATAPPLDFNTT